ncbi:hypothetical protein Tco_0534655 [Tanacetum coccineum]
MERLYESPSKKDHLDGKRSQLYCRDLRVQFEQGPVRARVLNDLSAEEKERREQVTMLMIEVDDSTRDDLALNVDHIFGSDEYHMDEYHEVHEMQNDVQHSYVVDSDADYTSDSNIIPYDQVYKGLMISQDMNLEHQIKEKDNVIRHLKDLVASVNDRSREPYNAVDVTALIEQNDCDRVELEKVKQHYKELYDSIKITRAHTSEKTSTMLNEIESLKAQLRSKEPCFTSDYVKPKVLAPGMYVIDVKPIPHPLKNNRSAHLNYISHLKESVEIVGEIVFLLRKKSRVNDSMKQADQRHRAIQSENRILPAKRRNKKDVDKYIGYQWRPTGKKLTLGKLDCGSQWRPTGRKFALDEMCHLTKLSVKCRTGHAFGIRTQAAQIYEGIDQAHEFCGKVIGSVRFGMIIRSYHGLWRLWQFCDSDLEVAFRKHTCFVRDIKGTNILKAKIRKIFKKADMGFSLGQWLSKHQFQDRAFIMTLTTQSGLAPTDKRAGRFISTNDDEHLEQFRVNEPKQLASVALCAVSILTVQVEPKNFKIGRDRRCCFQAMQDEIRILIDLKYWELVPRTNLCLMVIASQVDYNYTDRDHKNILCLMRHQEHVLYQMDVKTAFLMNTMAEQNVPAQPPTRTDEQIVPRSQWLTIGKSNLLFNAHLFSMLKRITKKEPHLSDIK